MNGFVSHIITSIIVVPLAFLAGYKLKQYVPQERRLFVGSAIVLSVIILGFAIVLGFSMISRPATSVAMSAAMGFPLGMALPPHNNSTRKNVTSKK